MRELVLAEGRHLSDADMRMSFVNLEFVSAGLCPIISDYDSLQNETKISTTGG